ncbi:transglutaminase domain-containing protein [Reichenbachiella agarivorans]|uniref:Transglutaminase domain-containing protein n=1 Tax=Reichenbachiella agarivorans TaxID=2979464 RepID=A0ABY6CQD0_9BACT|nr:transglutaminase domain-containing protein [Reichenbachiella agarivorans]UXP32569.1 transglutaminase domain-containing protein [Reichenbachiella agarivorans]
MRFPLVLVFLLFVQLSSHAQQMRYGVVLNGNTVGTLDLHTTSGSIYLTSSETKLSYVSTEDSTYIYTRTDYMEEQTGYLIAVNTRLSLSKGDTTSQTRIVNSPLRTDNAIPVGPVMIKNLSIKRLKKIGDSTQFYTYSPDYQSNITVHRSIQSQTIYQAKKYWIVRDSIPGLSPIISQFDQKFNLVSSTQLSALGQIDIRPSLPTDTIPAMLSVAVTSPTIASNILLPDPLNINAIEVQITDALGLTTDLQLADNTFSPLPLDSLEIEKTLDGNLIVDSDNLDVFSEADSLTMHLASPFDQALTLTHYCQEQHFRFPALKLVTLARAIDLPARLVRGYYYQYGVWVLGYWTEIGISDEWVIFNPNLHSSINPSLYIPLVKSTLDQGLTALFDTPAVQSIEITEYLWKRRAYHLQDPKRNPKKGQYSNQGLGLSFEIPKDFEIVAQDSVVISPTFLTLRSELGHIHFEQITLAQDIQQTIESIIKAYTPNANIESNKDIPAFQGISESKACLVIPQSSSLIVIRINSPAAGMILNTLCHKNLQIED